MYMGLRHQLLSFPLLSPSIFSIPERDKRALQVGAASETPSPQRWRHSPGDAKTLGVSWGLSGFNGTVAGAFCDFARGCAMVWEAER